LLSRGPAGKEIENPMTHETLYSFEAADGRRGPVRTYTGTGFGEIRAPLPSWYEPDIDDRLRDAGGCFTRARLRAWIDCLPPYRPPRTLAELTDHVDGLGDFLEAPLALRLAVFF